MMHSKTDMRRKPSEHLTLDRARLQAQIEEKKRHIEERDALIRQMVAWQNKDRIALQRLIEMRQPDA